MKRVLFCGNTRRRIKAFPEDARREVGHQLRNVQNGEEPDDWKTMSPVGPGVREIRIHVPHEHRVIYVAHFPQAIYVLHAFEKKTQRTPQLDIDTARSAYAQVEAERKKSKKA